MPFEKSVLVPLNADETFALITQPDWPLPLAGDHRARRPAGRGGVPVDRHSGTRPPGTFTEVELGRRVVFTWAGRLGGAAAGRVDCDHHAGARRGAGTMQSI